MLLEFWTMWRAWGYTIEDRMILWTEKESLPDIPTQACNMTYRWGHLGPSHPTQLPTENSSLSEPRKEQQENLCANPQNHRKEHSACPKALSFWVVFNKNRHLSHPGAFLNYPCICNSFPCTDTLPAFLGTWYLSGENSITWLLSAPQLSTWRHASLVVSAIMKEYQNKPHSWCQKVSELH
jgi:hypothetical protein